MLLLILKTVFIIGSIYSLIFIKKVTSNSLTSEKGFDPLMIDFNDKINIENLFTKMNFLLNVCYMLSMIIQFLLFVIIFIVICKI